MPKDVIFMVVGVVGLAMVGAGIMVGHTSLGLVGLVGVIIGSFAVEG